MTSRINAGVVSALVTVIGMAASPAAFAASWYVDNSVASSGNGQSWGTAWKNFSDIEWISVAAGDTIYVSGGATSQTYYETLTVGSSGTAGNPITITTGRDSSSASGHDGRVIIDGGGTRTQSIYVQNKNYVTVRGFECTHAEKGVYVEDNANTIVLDALDVHDYYGQAGIMLNASPYMIDNVTIKNSRIVSIELYAAETDGIYISGAQRTVIHDNYVHERNQDPLAHTDALQAYLANGFVIYNNYFINDSVYSPEGGGTPIILGSEGTNPVIIYNNFLYMGGVWDPTGNQNAILWTRWYDNNPMPPTWVIHNTVVAGGPRCRNFIQEYDAVTINNLFAIFTPSGEMDNLEESLPHPIQVADIRQNLFWRNAAEAGFAGQFTGNGNTGDVSGWSSWTTTYGGTGVNADPLFAHSYLPHTFGDGTDEGALNGELQAGSPAIDNGEDARTLIASLNSTYALNLPWADINGNPRDNTPTIGAYEYVPPCTDGETRGCYSGPSGTAGDGGTGDGGTGDRGAGQTGGCGCRLSPSGGIGGAWLTAFVLLGLGHRRRRRSGVRPRQGQ